MERFAGRSGLEATRRFQLPEHLHAFPANASSRWYRILSFVMIFSDEHPEPISQEAGTSAKVSPRSFSSVATYQNNISLITIDLDPRLDSNQERSSNKNLLANFDGTQDVYYDTPIGFVCDYNLPIPSNTTHYYTHCFMGNSRKLPRKDSDLDLVQIYDYIWEYPIAEAFDRSDKVYNYTDNDSLNSESNP